LGFWGLFGLDLVSAAFQESWEAESWTGDGEVYGEGDGEGKEKGGVGGHGAGRIKKILNRIMLTVVSNRSTDSRLGTGEQAA
jgi:hypothetical protein